MKRFLSLLLTVAMLTTMFATMVIPASATEGEGDPFYATFDTVRFTDGAYPVIIVADTADTAYYYAGWVSVSFKPTSEANTYEVVEGPANADLAVPENGFVWTAYEYSNAAEIVATRNIIRGFTPGDIITLNGVDFANKTVAENATIEYSYGFIIDNVAYGKSYTTSEPFRMGGADVDWGWDASKNPTYPDEGGVSLTDGSRPTARAYGDSAWTGIHTGTPDAKDKGYTWVTVDLAGNYNLTKISAYVAPNLGSGVSYAKDITFVAIDEDGNETVIKKITDADLKAIDDDSGNTCAYIEASVDCNVVASKIEIRMTAWGANGGFTFISEVAAYGSVVVPEVPGESTPDQPGEGGESTDDEVGGDDTAGTEADPIVVEDGDTVTVPAGATVYYVFNGAYGVPYSFTATGATGFCVNITHPRLGTISTPDVDGVVKLTLNCNQPMSPAPGGRFSITNNTDSEQNYALSISVPVGIYENPEVLELEVNPRNNQLMAFDTSDLEADNQGYYYLVVAPADGYLVISVSAFDAEYNDIGWSYNVDNITAGLYGDNISSDNANGTYAVAVSEGDEVMIRVATYDSENRWSNPAGTVSVTVGFATAGTSDFPEEITVGDYTASAPENSMYHYKYIATEAGVLTVTVTETTDAWQFVVNNITSYVYGELYDSTCDPLINTESVNVAVGDEVIIAIGGYDPNAPWAAPAADIDWTLSFVASTGGNEGGNEGGDIGGGDIGGGEETENYTFSNDPIILGESFYIVDGGYEYTVFTFEPTEIGKYTFTIADGVFGIAGYMWVNGELNAETVKDTTFEWSCTDVGQSILIAVMADTNIATITVTKEDISINQPTIEDYENVETPEDFVLPGNVDDLIGVDYEDDVVDTAVLGDDGYYHLNSATGPIIYVNLNDDALSLIAASSYGQLSYTDVEANVKTDYTEAFQEYVDAAGEAAIYPLTADLMEIIKKVCEKNDWNSFFNTESEDVWMALCYFFEADELPTYVKGDITGNGKIDARDYLLLKRIYFGTYKFDGALEILDVSGNGKLDARDYLLLKRAYFGTYTIEQ